MKRFLFLCVITFVVGFSGIFLTSCDDDDDKKIEGPGESTPNEIIYVLNQGGWGQNNASLTAYYVEEDSVVNNVFYDVNKRNLGDGGQDAAVYGSKLWITVSGSNAIEIVDVNTCESLKQLKIEQPRRMAFDKGFLYVTCYDGYLARIDTATYEVVEKIETGLNPEGVAIADGKVYVANSGGMNHQNGEYDNTVFVYNLPDATGKMSLKEELEVIVNPVDLVKVDVQTIMLYSAGVYEKIPLAIQTINTVTEEVIKIDDFKATNFTVKNDSEIYFYESDYGASNTAVGVYDWKSKQLVADNFTETDSLFSNPYGLNVNPVDNSVCVANADGHQVNGTAYLYDKNGKLKTYFEVGLYPCKSVFYNK